MKRASGIRRALVLLSVGLIVAGCGSSGEEEEPTDGSVLERAKAQEWVIGQSGTGAVVDGKDNGFTGSRAPVFKAEEELRGQGWEVTSQWMGSDEEVIQAAIQGTVDFAYVPFSSIIAAVSGGANFRAFTAGAALDFLVVGDSDIDGPEDMDGRSIAYQGPVSSGALVARLYTAQAPDANPTFLTIQGNGPRATALLAGEIDATAARLGSEQEIIDQSGGTVKILYEPLEDYPFLIDLVVAYNADRCEEECKAFAQEFTREQVTLNRQAIADPSIILDWIEEYDAISSDERAAGLYYSDAGMTIEVATQMINLLGEHGQLASGSPPAPEEVVDEEIWNAIADQVAS
jgi:ABC-type nitrate/sulfonate/bicarbonate transport system substrate-binding protein